jgi:hypothetical protein
MTELLERFAHRGTPHLFDEARQSASRDGSSAADCPVFQLNQSLFESTQEKTADRRALFGRGATRR